MDRRGFLAMSAGSVAALLIPALAIAEDTTLIVLNEDASSVLEGTSVNYDGKPLVFSIETTGTGSRRRRQISARSLKGFEASEQRLQELVADFAIVVTARNGKTKTLFREGQAFSVADGTSNAASIDLYVQAPGDTRWFHAIRA